jgi:alkylation response protein AidB-like acyl-CoA dehydrogenase
MLETRYHPNADQLALADEITDSIADLLPLARLHASKEETPEIWDGLHGLGLFGIAVNEEYGGTGLGATEEALIVTGLGRCLVAPSVLATMGTSHAMPSRIQGTVKELPHAMAGYRNSRRVVAVRDSAAKLLLVRDGNEGGIYDVGSRQPKPLDGRNWAATLDEYSGVGEPLIRLNSSLVTRLRLLDAAFLAGIAETATEMAVAYAGLREQFGRPIGSFQAVKHHCANMAIAARSARDQTNFAAVAFDEGREDANLQVECALFVAGSAAIENASKNIQIHGGIGFSDEADPHLLLKRAQLQVAIAGGLEASNARIAEMGPVW